LYIFFLKEVTAIFSGIWESILSLRFISGSEEEFPERDRSKKADRHAIYDSINVLGLESVLGNTIGSFGYLAAELYRNGVIHEWLDDKHGNKDCGYDKQKCRTIEEAIFERFLPRSPKELCKEETYHVDKQGCGHPGEDQCL